MTNNENNMATLTNQISHSYAINTAIIMALINGDEFQKACREVPIEYGVVPNSEGAVWPFRNMSWYASSLYCLLVVPKELYKSLDKSDEFYNRLINKDVFGKFDVNSPRYTFTDDPERFFKSFRNSISHVSYEWRQESRSFRFFDFNPHTSDSRNPHWEIVVTQTDLDEFLGQMANATIQLYNEITSGHRDANGRPINGA